MKISEGREGKNTLTETKFTYSSVMKHTHSRCANCLKTSVALSGWSPELISRLQFAVLSPNHCDFFILDKVRGGECSYYSVDPVGRWEFSEVSTISSSLVSTVMETRLWLSRLEKVVASSSPSATV